MHCEKYVVDEYALTIQKMGGELDGTFFYPSTNKHASYHISSTFDDPKIARNQLLKHRKTEIKQHFIGMFMIIYSLVLCVKDYLYSKFFLRIKD